LPLNFCGQKFAFILEECWTTLFFLLLFLSIITKSIIKNEAIRAIRVTASGAYAKASATGYGAKSGYTDFFYELQTPENP